MEQDNKRKLFKELHMIDHMSKMLVRAGMQRAGLKDVGHPYILKVLDESGDEGLVVSQKKFAKKLMISPAAIAQSIKRMDKEGLITKITDEHDLRVNRIAITDKGRAFMKKMDRGLDFAAETIFIDFSDEDMDQLYMYTRRIIKNIIKFKENYNYDEER